MEDWNLPRVETLSKGTLALRVLWLQWGWAVLQKESNELSAYACACACAASDPAVSLSLHKQASQN